MPDDLKSCPFCGAIMEDFHGSSFTHPLVEKQEDACILAGLSFSYQHSRWGSDETLRWNRREPAIEALQARIVELEALLDGDLTAVYLAGAKDWSKRNRELEAEVADLKLNMDADLKTMVREGQELKQLRAEVTRLRTVQGAAGVLLGYPDTFEGFLGYILNRMEMDAGVREFAGGTMDYLRALKGDIE